MFLNWVKITIRDLEVKAGVSSKKSSVLVQPLLSLDALFYLYSLPSWREFAVRRIGTDSMLVLAPIL